jgi:Mitochondrial carrier protein
LTWTFFQQLKVAQHKLSGRQATNFENTIMGCVASGTTVCIMIPMDTIKTRLVTQATNGAAVPYKGIIDCAVRVAREEGIKSFYKGLPPRLVSVVPMIGIQFTVYEAMKRVMQKRQVAEQRMQQQKPALAAKKQQTGKKKSTKGDFDPYTSMEVLQESCMEVAASPEHPYPAPHFSRILEKKKEKKQWGWLRQDKK